MVRILILSAFFCLAQAALAAESGTVFQDGSAFILARSVKLGADGSDKKLPNGKVPYKFEKKEKYECVKDADCAGVFICRSNKCIDPCTGVTCPGGQKCSVGKCVSCSRGEACGCTGTTVSSGSGSCFDPCDPNKCVSTTPTCSRSGADYSCACTSTSCGAGKKCSGSSCTNCAANESCQCPSGQKANGSGGCAAVACSSNSDCGAGKQCANAGTISSYCYNCSANSQCTCPSGQLANGSGGCVKPVCYDNTPCGAGRQCIDPGKYNAKCDPCPSGTQCTCPSGQVADGSGGCGTACQYTPAKCAAENGGSASDWTVANAGTGSCSCSTTKKYVIMADMKPDCNGAEYYSNLRRIKAVKDFGNVKAGTLGGYIESEANLSQTGNAWVGCDSRGCAWVTGNAKVYGNALVEGAGKTNMRGEYDYYCGATRVSNNAEVYGDAKVLAGSEIYAGKVYGRAVFHGIGKYPGTSEYPEVFAKGSYYVSGMSIGGEVYDDAQIYLGGYVGGAGSAPDNKQKVHGHAIVAGGKPPVDERSYIYYSADVSGYAKIIGGAEVSGSAKVYGNAVVDGGQVSGNAQVYDNARVGKKGYVQGKAKLFGNAVFDPGYSSSRGLPYLCGTASLSGTAKVTSVPESNKNSICKNSYTSGSPGWQESYCSSKNCPQ